MYYHIRENFHLTKISPNPDSRIPPSLSFFHYALLIAEIFGGINFRQCGKGCHILYVIINTRQKICMIKISPMRADGEIGENFLLAKISTYIVYWYVYTLGKGTRTYTHNSSILSVCPDITAQIVSNVPTPLDVHL